MEMVELPRAERLVQGAGWAELIDHLAAELKAELTDPFARARVIVSSRATGRVAGQGVAARLGISAGIDFLSPADLMRTLAESAGCARDRARWMGTPLVLAVADSLSEAAPTHPLLQRALSADETRPGRRLATAARVARLFRGYLDLAPGLIAAWLDVPSADAGLDGAPLPGHLAWQPGVLRSATDRLELSPVGLLDAITQAAASDTTPTFLLAADDFTAPQHRVLEALRSGVGVTELRLAGPPRTPVVEVHDSHGEARQVEVLRDELTRAFADDPTLEPRDVLVVCPRPERFARLLDAAFAPQEGHPGRTLRVQPVASGLANPVLELAVQLLRLKDSRATASGILELLLQTPIAHRWGLTDRHSLTELIAGAGVRWGLDAEHRAGFGLGELRQNTWVRGLDRLLVGLASAPGDDVGLGLSGAETISASDLSLVGAVCEIVSRLRQIVDRLSAPGTVPEWVARIRQALSDLVGLPRDDEWQLWQAHAVLARFEADHADRVLTRHEFAQLLGDASAAPRARVAAGNGALQIVPLGELLHVEHRVVALLGVTDDAVPGRAGHQADSIDLGELTPDPAATRLGHLVAHARAAERLIIVRQARSPRTNDPTAKPVAISWLLDQLGVADEAIEHPPTATSADSFGERPSFDLAAYAGAQARSLPRLGDPAELRRNDARSRPLGEYPDRVTLEALVAFLVDPARTFLRGPGGITLYDDPSVTDEIALVTDPLVHWGVVDALVTSLKTGTPIEEVERDVSRREQLPPGALGGAAFARARNETVSLWSRAGTDWAAEAADHGVELELDPPLLGQSVTLTGAVRTRGGAVVEITASKGVDKLIRPWVESLALAASGRSAEARLHQLEKERREVFGVTRRIAPVDQETARGHLAVLLTAFGLAQHRLLPVPTAPALRYAQEAHRGKFQQGRWRGLLGDWRTPYWSSVSSAWALFYSGDLGTLFSDSPVDTDPPGHDSPFQGWATTLYGPLVRSLA